MIAVRLVGLVFGAAVVTAANAASQQPGRFQSVRGLVRDTAGVPLESAEVLLGRYRALTNAQGTFRLDSIPIGQYPITVRLPGYLAARSRVGVVATEPTRLEYYLYPAPPVLPEIVVEGRRTGIYGSVGDTSFRALEGATVQVLGNRGGTALSDSMGRFAFPDADHGVYLVRATMPGYGERRIFVEVPRGKGKELSVLLAPAAAWRTSRIVEQALQDLDRRLAWSLRRSVMTRGELNRYGSQSLCDLPRVSGLAGREATVIIDGETVLREWPLCSIRVDEVELLEFGDEICRDRSGSLATLTGTYCSGTIRSVGNAQRVLRPGASSAVGRGGGYVLIWRRR